MLKTARICQIADTPGYINVSGMAKQFENGLRLNKDSRMDQMKKFVLKTPESMLASDKRREVLLPYVQDKCRDVQAVKTKDVEISADLYEKYESGEVIFIDNTKSSRTCATV
jgi:hypothetical protein